MGGLLKGPNVSIICYLVKNKWKWQEQKIGDDQRGDGGVWLIMMRVMRLEKKIGSNREHWRRQIHGLVSPR